MSVNVQKECCLFFVVADFLFEGEDLRLSSFAGELPLPVDITSRNIGSVVSADDPVDVHHWYYFELKFIS